MVASTQHLFIDAHAPVGDFGWGGVGHRYDPTRGVSVPGTWSIDGFDERTTTTFTPLPVPDRARGGNAWSTAVVGSHELAVGRIVNASGAKSLALWQRDDPDANWTLRDGTDLGLPPSEVADTRASDVRGNEAWGLLLTVTTPYASEAAAQREIPTTKQLFRSVDGQEWQLVELGPFETEEWNLGIYVDGSHGLITATRNPDVTSELADYDDTDEDRVAEVRLLITTDAGATWTNGEIALDDESTARVRDALWLSDTWMLAGSVDRNGDREPALWERHDAGAGAANATWHRQEAGLGPVEQFGDSDLEFAAIRQRGESDFLALIDLMDGSRTVLSDDLVSWTDSENHWINRVDNDARARLSTLVTSPTGDRFLALRGFDSPVRIDKNGSTVINTDVFDTDFRSVRSVFLHEEWFIALVIDHSTHDPQWSRIWRSEDGVEWTWIATESERLLDDGVSIGAQMLAHLTVLDDGMASDLMFRTYDSEGYARTFDPFDLVPEATTLRRFVSSPATGRPLLATSSQGAVIFVFADPNLPEASAAFVVPDTLGTTAAVCPELATGEFAVALATDDAGTTIEVWADREDPRLASGPLTLEGTAEVDFCDRWGSGLALAGQLCRHAESVAGPDSQDAATQCQAMLWSSPDGRAWTPHPQAGLLGELGTHSVSGLAGSDTVAFMATEHDDGHALWLVTSDELIEIPLHDAPHFDNLKIANLALKGDTLLVDSGSGLFTASVSATMERVAADTGRDPSDITTSTPSWTSADALVSSSDLNQPATVLELPTPTPDPQAPSTPSTPTQAAVPAPPVAAAPTATALPAPTATGAPVQPGTDGDTGTSVTLTCTFTTDATTGVVTEVCE